MKKNIIATLFVFIFVLTIGQSVMAEDKGTVDLSSSSGMSAYEPFKDVKIDYEKGILSYVYPLSKNQPTPKVKKGDNPEKPSINMLYQIRWVDESGKNTFYNGTGVGTITKARVFEKEGGEVLIELSIPLGILEMAGKKRIRVWGYYGKDALFVVSNEYKRLNTNKQGASEFIIADAGKQPEVPKGVKPWKD